MEFWRKKIRNPFRKTSETEINPNEIYQNQKVQKWSE